MAFCTAKEMVAAGKRDPNLTIRAGGANLPIGGINEQRAEEILKLAFGDVLTQNMNAYSKFNRPWKLVNLTDKLDSAQSWLGWEFEMALQSEADFRRLVTYVWYEHNHVAFDKEGAGQWSPEISFPPENASNFNDGTAGILRLLKWMEDNSIKLMDVSTLDNRFNVGGYGAAVGQHLNVSTPTMRSKKNAVNVGTLIAHTMWMMSVTKHKELFGRLPYGLCRGRDEGAGQYCEFKLFKATDDLRQFKKYLLVSQRMSDLMEAVAGDRNLTDGRESNTRYIKNFYDILTGNASPTDYVIAEARNANAFTKLITDGGGNGNGSNWRFSNGLGPAMIS